MKKFFSIIALAALCLMAGCDKINPEDYLIFGGATGTWYDGNGVADHTQRAFLEKYTGISCVNCPDADVTITNAMGKYGDKLVVVGVHGSSFFGNPINGFDLRCEDAVEWLNSLLGASAGLPSALLMRDVPTVFNPVDNFDGKVDPILAQAPSVAIEVNSQLQGRNATVTVNLELLQDISEELNLTLFIMEDGIVGPQKYTGGLHEDYIHNHVLRDVITDIWGMPVEIDGKAGTARYVVIDYTVADNWVAENCKLVAFVSKKSDKTILNVAECEL